MRAMLRQRELPRPIQVWSLVGLVLALVVAALILARPTAADTDLSEWAVAHGLALEVAGTGFVLPTAIAAVQEPGTDPSDPVYFVAELRGALKAVTNDGNVVNLVSMPTIQPDEDLMRGSDEQSGMGGLCFADQDDLLFATFAYPDEDGVLRNDVVRIDLSAGLDPPPSAIVRFTEVFAEFQTASAHQIGACDVQDGKVYIGLGDGGDVSLVSDPAALLGKVVCLDFAGEPCDESPWSEDGPPAAYSVATGLRNPFGVRVVGGRIFVVDNGRDIDRFLSVDVGDDYLWDGTDESIATVADVVFSPAVAPVQLGHIDGDNESFGNAWADHFVMSVFNDTPATGILAIAYDHDRDRPRNVPYYLLQYLGDGPQHVVPVAIGPRGLYTAGSIPGEDGTSDILRVYEDPDERHPVTIDRDWGQAAADDQTLAILEGHSCVSCHAREGVGGGIGPSLDTFGLRTRLIRRLDTDGYEQSLRQLNEEADTTDPVSQWRVEAREAVLEAERGHERARIWMPYFLQDPQFDDPSTTMPNPRLTSEEAQEITEALLGTTERFPFLRRVSNFATANLRPLLVGFVGGVGATLVSGAALVAMGRIRGRRRDGQDVRVP